MESKYKAQINYSKRKGLVKIGFDSSPEIREKFHEACKKNNTTATKVLKDFVNDYIKENEKDSVK